MKCYHSHLLLRHDGIDPADCIGHRCHLSLRDGSPRQKPCEWNVGRTHGASFAFRFTPTRAALAGDLPPGGGARGGEVAALSRLRGALPPARSVAGPVPLPLQPPVSPHRCSRAAKRACASSDGAKTRSRW